MLNQKVFNLSDPCLPSQHSKHCRFGRIEIQIAPARLVDGRAIQIQLIISRKEFSAVDELGYSSRFHHHALSEPLNGQLISRSIEKERQNGECRRLAIRNKVSNEP